jgi:hypothetical protein
MIVCLFCKAMERSLEAAYVSGLCAGLGLGVTEDSAGMALMMTFCARHRELIMVAIQQTCNQLGGTSGESVMPEKTERPS